MPSSNFVVSGLTAYIEQNKDLLLKNFALVGTDTRKRIGIQTGVKYKEHLHYLELAPVLQSGSECGFSASGTATLSERLIECADIKVNMDICPKHLVGKYAEYLVRINANENDLPFEQYIIDGVIAEINKKIEKLIWQGDKSQTSDANIKWIDGFIEQMSDDASYLASAMISASALAHGTTAWNAILAVYKAMPEETLERGGVIFVSPALYREFVLDLVAKNFYHYAGPDAAYPEEIYFPGTNVKVVKTPGLAGTTLPTLVGTFADNLVYGCDMENDNEDIKVWFSDDDDLWKIKVNWNTGVAYHFPGQIVLAEIAAS